MTSSPSSAVSPLPGVAAWRLSPTDAQYFFGYYDKTPWSHDQAKLLCGRTQVAGRQPTADDALEVGYFDLADAARPFVPIGVTRLWNWQQGCMLQWAGADRVFFNRHASQGQAGSVTMDLRTGASAEHPWPIYALAPGGAWGLSVNFARIHAIRPGYGYAGLPDDQRRDDASPDDGLFHVDLRTGERTLWVSLRHLAQTVAGQTQADPCHQHKINHVQINRQGTAAAFLYRWVHLATGKRYTQMMVIDADGQNLRRVGETGMVSHYDWMNEREICAWARQSDVGDHYLIYHTTSGAYRTLGQGTLAEDGHLSFSPDGRWMLTDTYPDAADDRHLLLWDMHASRLFTLGSFHGPLPQDHHIRCDLHPRWNRQGDAVCFDSVHEGTRGLYVMDLPSLR